MTWETRKTGKKPVPVPLISQYIYTMECIFSHFSPETLINSITAYYFDDDSNSKCSSNINNRRHRRHNHLATRSLSIFAHSAQFNHCASIRPEGWAVES
jgi:hypothetical protein